MISMCPEICHVPSPSSAPTIGEKLELELILQCSGLYLGFPPSILNLKQISIAS
jgi:hypothetical protein